MNNKDWNPERYLKYEKERTQPSIDLVSRIKINNPLKIIDIGCGRAIAPRYWFKNGLTVK